MDLRFALRSLRKNSGFALLAVLVMALGIGANSAIFSVVNTVLLRPLAYCDPDSIVVLSSLWKMGGGAGPLWKQVSEPDFQDWREQSTGFVAMAYYASQKASVMSHAAAEYAQVSRVSPDFFKVFSVEPAMGRLLSAEEIVISHAYWQNHFSGNPTALGQTVRMFGKTLTIVGVLPPGFNFPDKTDIWFPTNTISIDTTQYRSAQNYLAVGRLKPGVSLEQAQTQMTSIASRLEQQYPKSNAGRSVAVTRLRDEMTGDVRLTLYLLLGAVGGVLLIACANMATLLLAKATARTREIAIRAAVGASRGRIVRQLVTESLLLAIVSGAAALVLAVWGVDALVALAPSDVPRLAETRIDGWVLAFTSGISVLASLLFGLAPALHASRIDLNEALKQGAARAVVGGAAARMRSALVVAEIAMSVVLLAGAGLLIKSLVALHHVSLGFHPENVLAMKASVPATDLRGNQFFKDLLTSVSTLPGILAAGATMSPPGHVDSNTVYFIDRMPKDLDISGPQAVMSVVAPGTFAALGIPLKSGRDFNDTDGPDAARVAVINEALVRKSFGAQDPIGRTIFCPFDDLKPMKIVGVAGNVRQYGPEREPAPECYMTYQQHGYNGATLTVVVRTAADPRGLAEIVRRKVRELSPEVSVEFSTMDAKLAQNVAAPRFRTLLLGIFAGLAVCLAMAGIYGVMAFVVGQRFSEFGLRMALGASRGDILRLVLHQGLTLAIAGLALGLIGAVVATRLLTSILFEVKPADPLTYAGVAILLGAVTLAASYLPARRATRIDPLIALRQE